MMRSSWERECRLVSKVDSEVHMVQKGALGNLEKLHSGKSKQ